MLLYRFHESLLQSQLDCICELSQVKVYFQKFLRNVLLTECSVEIDKYLELFKLSDDKCPFLKARYSQFTVLSQFIKKCLMLHFHECLYYVQFITHFTLFQCSSLF